MASSKVTVTRADVGLRSERGPVLLAIMLAVGLVAIDSTVLATAVPAVVDDLGGLTQLPWLFSIYLLGQAVSLPLCSKLADQYGRKPVMLLGVGFFVAGSLACALAWSIGSLVAFRAVQGLAAGAVIPVSMTMVGDLYSVAERAKVTGYIASVYALAAIVGPTLGGVFADFVSWRWIFLINLPLGAVTVWMLGRRFAEDTAHTRPRFDVVGAVLLSVGGVLLLLALLEGGVRWRWTSWISCTTFAVAVGLLVAFVFVERKACEPVLPLWVFRHRTVLPAVLISLLVGVLMMALTTYIPLYGQTVLGHGAVASGLALSALLLGWPLASSNSGRLYLSIGFRRTIILGSSIAFVGTLLLLPVNAHTSVWLVAAPCFVMGLGFGLGSSPVVIAAQASVERSSRGVATGATMLARSVGSALGVAAFGALANAGVTDRVQGPTPDLEQLDPAVLEPAVHAVFVGAVVAAGLLIGASLLVPRHDPGARNLSGARKHGPRVGQTGRWST